MDNLLNPIIWLILLALWTLALRIFPGILTTTFEKRLESHYSTKLATLTAELEAKYSTLRTSVDYLSMQQSAMKSHVIPAVELLWNEILTIRQRFGDILILDTILVPKEIRDLYASGAQGGIGTVLKDYRNFDHIEKQLPRLDDSTCEKCRLFVGERLWLLFSTIRGVYGRYMMLTHMSLQDNEYRDWRQDKLMIGHLSSCLPSDNVEKAKSKAVGGLQLALSYLKADFLKEALRVMSGSQHFADSLADLQSTLLSEKQRLDAARQVPASPGGSHTGSSVP